MQRWQSAARVLAGIVLLVLPCPAQVVIGDNLQLHLNGDISTFYNGSSSDLEGSGHGLSLGGDAYANGSYYNPNFLSFNVQPYYARQQNNSTFGSITDSSGVNANLNLFSGSHFPGTISYSRAANSSGEFGIPGSGVGLATHGDNQGFGIGWSAFVAGWPTLSASYGIGTGSSSIFGGQNESTQTNHNFTLRSGYLLDGFRLDGAFSHITNQANLSEVLETGQQQPVMSDTSSNSYQVSASHSFPMHGGFGMGWSRTTYSYGSDGIENSGSSDALNGNLAFNPTRKLTLAFNGAYNDSLLGGLPQELLSNGSELNLTSANTFHSFLMGADANYQLLNNLGLHAGVNHSEQMFLGRSYGMTQLAANAYYQLQRRLLGSLSFNVGVVDSATKEGNTALGAVANLNFFRRIDGWELQGNFSYAQNVQTLLVVYTTSSMGWVTNASHKLGNRMQWMVGYGGNHSGITQGGTSSSASNVNSTFLYGRTNINGFYTTSNGMALFTPTGLVAIPTPLPPTVFAPNAVIEFNSTAYGFNMGTTFRRWVVSAGYANSRSATIDPMTNAFAKNNLVNLVTEYRLRKLYLRGGYTRLQQSLGTPGSVPVMLTSYYGGITRWFNWF